MSRLVLVRQRRKAGSLGLETVMDTAALAEARTAAAARSANIRSKVTNGSRRHQKGATDGRSASARRFRDLIAGFAAPYGGEAALTVGEQALVRNAAALTLKLEQMQADAAAGRPVDSEQLTRLANSAARTLASLRKGREHQMRSPALAVASPAVQPAPARVPTIGEVIAEQARRALGSSMAVAEAESASAAPDLTGFSDDVLARVRRLLESAEGSDG